LLENCVKDAFNRTLKETFKESLVDEPVYSSYIMPKEKSARDYTVFAQVKFNRWLVNRFKVGGINSDMFGYYEGLTEGRNSDKAVYTRTQLGTILDFAVPGGFLFSDKKKITPLRVSGEPTEPVNPLLQLVRTDLEQKKSNLNTLLSYLPEKTKYKVGGITGSEYEFQEKPYVAVVPRQGKTIVGVVFLSHQPGGKKTKGTKLRVQEQEFEVGVPHGGNLVNAYHLIRYFQDMPDICKVDAPRTAEVPPITDFAKKSNGSILEFLALEIARESYASGSPPISLKDFLTIQGSVPELEKQINGEYSDIKPAKWGLTQSV
jgi:hypothetical protein